MDDLTKEVIRSLRTDLVRLTNAVAKFAPDKHQFYNDVTVDEDTIPGELICLSDHTIGPSDPVSDVNSAILSPDLVPAEDRDPVFVQALKSADRVEKAFLVNWPDNPLKQDIHCLADALDALAGECLHETPPGVHGSSKGRRYMLSCEIRAIANELRQ